MCHYLVYQSNSSTLITCLTCTPTIVDANGGGDIIRMPSEEVGEEDEDKSTATGALSRRPFLVLLWTFGREKFIFSRQ